MTVLLGSSGVCWSADLQKGLDAAKREDYATALKEWTPLAKQGILGIGPITFIVNYVVNREKEV